MTVDLFGRIEKEEIFEVQLRHPSGMYASVLTWGATLRDLKVPVKGKGLRRVVLGYQDMEGYLVNPNYLGATVGRNSNRIRNGGVWIDEKHYSLTVNENNTAQLHGGHNGFSRKNWTIVRHDEQNVHMKLYSPDGEEGYPGNVLAECVYSFVSPTTLRIALSATTDAPTILNMTHHSYFTLNNGEDCRDHGFWIDADFFTPADNHLLPTGEILHVQKTGYDFREKDILRSTGIDYDINFVLNKHAHPLPVVAKLWAPDNSLGMAVSTNQPGVQLYNACGLSQYASGIEGQIHKKYGGICLEPQAFPDTPNFMHFPSTKLRPTQNYQNVMEYHFF